MGIYSITTQDFYDESHPVDHNGNKCYVYTFQKDCSRNITILIINPIKMKRILPLLLLVSIVISAKANDKTPPPPVLTRGPYLQMGNQTSITIHWRTDIASNSRVTIGNS